MHWKVSVTYDGQLTVVDIYGELSGSDLPQFVQDIQVQAGGDQRPALNLIQFADGATLNASPVDLYLLPEAMHKLGVRMESKIAVVANENAHFFDDLKFHELMSGKVGFSIEVFNDRSEALEWLGL